MGDQGFAQPTFTPDTGASSVQGAELYEQPHGNAAVIPDSFFEVVQRTRMYGQTGGELLDLRQELAVGEIVREARPAEEPPDGDYAFVATIHEVFAWVDEDAVEPVEAGTGWTRMPVVEPEGELPTLGRADYDRLSVLEYDTPLFRLRTDTEPSTTGLRMETYVVMKQEDGWEHVKLLRDPPVFGWMQPSSRRIDPAPDQGAAPQSRLSVDMVHPDVIELEQILRELGYYEGIPDERFRALTDEAVREFQRDHGLEDDGEVGPLTWAALRGARGTVEAGSWASGYTVPHPAYFRASPLGADTPAPAVGVISDVADIEQIQGEVDVLFVGGAPAETVSGGDTLWFVRRADGKSAGWVHASQVQSGSGPQTHSQIRDEIAASCPNGITVAFVVQHQAVEDQFSTFLSEAGPFVAATRAVALSGGQLVTGAPNLVHHKDDIVSVLAQIQEILRGDEAVVPPWARVAHLAVFTHGGAADHGDRHMGGLNTSSTGWEDRGNLRMDDLGGFANSLALFGTPDLHVSFFACSTGRDTFEGENSNQPEFAMTTAGEDSFADNMSDSLAASGMTEGTVMGHITEGPTVRNPNARLFGGDAYAINPFNAALLPMASWLGPELEAALTFKTAEFLQDELWDWYYDRFHHESEFAFLASQDLEAFRILAQRDAKVWFNDQLPGWGVFLGGYELGSDTEIQAAYPSQAEYRTRYIPPRAPLTPIGGTQTWKDPWGEMVPVQWINAQGQEETGWIKKIYLAPVETSGASTP